MLEVEEGAPNFSLQVQSVVLRDLRLQSCSRHCHTLNEHAPLARPDAAKDNLLKICQSGTDYHRASLWFESPPSAPIPLCDENALRELLEAEGFRCT